MFAVMTFERDPMQFQDIPAGLVSWVQTAGGWAAFGVFVWLLRAIRGCAAWTARVSSLAA